MFTFPETYERVIYDKNPLFEVVCQLKFPTILKVGTQPPVDFHEKIKAKYPIVNDSGGIVPKEVQSMFKGAGIQFSPESSYQFKSEDEQWKVVIAKDFVSVSTGLYRKFEEFKQNLDFIFSAFSEIYEPVFLSRVGLRYQNLIVRSQLSLIDVPWTDLISTEICPELHNPVMQAELKYYMKNLVFHVGENETLNFKHGIVEATFENSRKEDSYLLDSDFYAQRKVENYGEAIDIISRFNRSTGRLFRWSICDRLHEAMDPKALE
jgi:uncharacterized protein (TIGR04255 family)